MSACANSLENMLPDYRPGIRLWRWLRALTRRLPLISTSGPGWRLANLIMQRRAW